MPNFESIENKSRFVQATKPCLYWMCSLLSYCKLFLSFEICSDWISLLCYRTPIELGEGSERRKCFNSFISSITLYIPNYGNIQCYGDARADKKSSFDSAALVMLYELQRRGKLIIDR